MDRPEELEQQLRTAGLRVTQPRLAVLRAVRTHPHADTATVIAAARQQLPELSHQAVYDGLAALTATGLLQAIKPFGSVVRYESRVGDNHHHLICRACGAVTDVDCAVGLVPCLEPSDDHGYLVERAEVNYWGLCPDCARQQHMQPADRPADHPAHTTYEPEPSGTDTTPVAGSRPSKRP